MILHKEHKGAIETRLDDLAEGPSIDVYAGLAARIRVTELGGGRSPEGMAEDADLLQVEAPLKPPGRILLIQLRQAIQQKAVVSDPGAYHGV